MVQKNSTVLPRSRIALVFTFHVTLSRSEGSLSPGKEAATSFAALSITMLLLKNYRKQQKRKP
jgi:hypothetical protein